MSFLQRIYLAMPPATQNLLISAYGYRQRAKRYGGDYRAILAEVQQSTSASVEEIRSMQAERLQAMLEHCARTVPYYRHALSSGSGWESLPILSKQTVRERQRELVSSTARRYWTNQTSGSTGTPLDIELDARTYRYLMALVEDHEQRHGMKSRGVRATFAGRILQPQSDNRPPFWRFNRAENQHLFSTLHLSDPNMPSYIERLAEIQPDEIIGYPSAIYAVAEFCLRHGRKLGFRPDVVVTNSETLLAWQREAIELAFGCPVADYYGLAEGVVFASQCARGSYHFNPLLGVVEVLDERDSPVAPGQAGRLICTTLTNYRMPLLRYDTGDEVKLSDTPCDCRNASLSASGILGRMDDSVVTSDGRSVGRLDHIFKGTTGIRECQIVQTDLRRIVLRVVPDTTLAASVMRTLTENLQARVGSDMQVEFEIVDKIPRTSRGKFKSVISLQKSRMAQ